MTLNLTDWQISSIIFIMLFLHIVDDYYLQGCLANLKQKDWWRKQEGYCKLYENDYITALVCHAFSWSFMVNLPWLILTKGDSFIYFISLMINFMIHAVVDNLKANNKIINLQGDQSIHFIQIFITWVVYISVYCNY